MPLLLLLTGTLCVVGFGADSHGGHRRPQSSTPEPARSAQPLRQAVPFVPVGGLQAARLPGTGQPATEPNRVPGVIAREEYSLDYARRTLLPAMGDSTVAADFDADGQQDLYMLRPGGSNRLLRNEGSGAFSDRTAQAGLAGPGGSLAAAVADLDNSGLPSVFIAGLGGITFYRSQPDGTFVDETQRAGLAGMPGELGTRVVLRDFDGDGFVDVLLTLYVDLSAPPPKPSFVYPGDFSGTSSRLYRNKGDNTFEDVTASAGLAEDTGRARNAVAADFDNNGFPDILLLRDDRPPAFYMNRGGGKFERTWKASREISVYAFFDAGVADFNQDSRPDLILWSTMGGRILLNRGEGRFAAAESDPPIVPPASLLGFHGTIADLDGNGFDDVLAVDAAGSWHFFANDAGRFQARLFAISLEAAPDGTRNIGPALPALVRLDALAPRPSNRRDDPEFVALQPNGDLVFLRRPVRFASPDAEPKAGF